MSRYYFAEQQLMPGYAETSTRRRPITPETVVVGAEEASGSRCVGSAVIDGVAGWLAFKIRGQQRYYFQYRPW